ncbi:MAG: PilZ domain-containing protein [Gemmatimonadota bacterium]
MAATREHYRIQYPTRARPVFEVGERRYPVADLSEGGMRIRQEAYPEPLLGETLQGTLKFAQGDTVEVRGRVLRIDEGNIALRLDAGVPFKIILDEQRFLRDHHRGLAW